MEIGAIILFGVFILGIITRYIFPNANKLKIYINKFLIYFGLPLVVYSAIQKTEFSKIANYVLLVSIIVIAIVTITYILILYTKIKRKEKATLHQCSSIGNVAYLGIPFSYAFFGPEGAIIAGVFSFITMFVHYTFALFLSQTYITKSKLSYVFLKKPFIWILIFVFILAQFKLPNPAIIGQVSAISIYLAVFIVGVSLNIMAFKKEEFTFVWLKLLLAPLIATPIILLWKVNLPLAFILLSAMPSAFSNTAICLEFGFDEELASRITSLGTLIFFIFMGVIFLIL